MFSLIFARPLFSYSYALFCHSENDKLFVFRGFHTLCPKHPGWGYTLQSKFLSFRNPTTHHSLLVYPRASRRATISFGITSFADPYQLSPIESHLYKKHRRVGVLVTFLPPKLFPFYPQGANIPTPTKPRKTISFKRLLLGFFGCPEGGGLGLMTNRRMRSDCRSNARLASHQLRIASR